LLIATLIAAGRLDDRLLAEALERVPGAAFHAWVDEGDSVDLAIPEIPAARTALECWNGCDVVVQEADHRAKRLLVADMDSTMIGQECIDELADYAGFKREVAAITERAMRGELEFAPALAERVALLAGLEVAVLGQCLAERIRPSPGAATLVRTMRTRGAHTMLVSGGFLDFVEPIAAALGFHDFRANTLAREAGRLTGKTKGPIVGSDAKKTALVEEQMRLGLSSDDVLAIGDGANDLPMIQAAGLGVAFRAKPLLASFANARLDNHGLDALLWAQGISRRDWVVG
jgi:phosphoserine phosphatase